VKRELPVRTEKGRVNTTRPRLSPLAEPWERQQEPFWTIFDFPLLGGWHIHLNSRGAVTQPHRVMAWTLLHKVTEFDTAEITKHTGNRRPDDGVNPQRWRRPLLGPDPWIQSGGLI